jgi:hypothetical protein
LCIGNAFENLSHEEREEEDTEGGQSAPRLDDIMPIMHGLDLGVGFDSALIRRKVKE